MPSSQRSELEGLLGDRARATIERALRSDGEVPPGEIDGLERLARLVELQKRTAPPEPRRPWPVIAIALATLVIVSILVFARVGQTEIELEVNASEVGFVLGERQVFLESAALKRIGASGLAGVELPEPFDALLAEGSDGDAAIRVSVKDADGTPGSINIGAIALSEGAEVSLRKGDHPTQYRLSLRDPRESIQVDVAGGVEVALAGVPPRTDALEAPRAIVLRPAPGVVSLDMELIDPRQSGVTSQVAARQLRFSRVDEFPDRSLGLVRKRSTIVGGTLYLEALNSAKRQIRAGEDLHFDSSRGTIRMIRLDPEHLSLNFHGEVGGMRTGEQNLMPTWLEWLRARHGLSLFWGSVVYLFGFGLAAVRWVKGAL